MMIGSHNAVSADCSTVCLLCLLLDWQCGELALLAALVVQWLRCNFDFRNEGKATERENSITLEGELERRRNVLRV